MMNVKQKQQGYSLVEVLVAVTVLLIALVGPLTIASKGLKNASLAREQNTAFFLAQEGIEAVVKIREDNALSVYAGNNTEVWDKVEAINEDDACTTESPCGVDVDADFTLFECSTNTCDLYISDSGRGIYGHNSSGDATNYNRELVVNVNESRVHVLSTVTWGEASDQQLTLSTYLYNIYDNE